MWYTHKSASDFEKGDGGMLVRPYRESDGEALCDLFLDTIHNVCARDYDRAQRDAWAPADFDRAAFCARLAHSVTLVVECDGVPLGFANLGQDGYFDCLYVSALSQRKGVATLLADAIEAHAVQNGVRRMTSDVSITARPFFEGRGYRVVREQTVQRRGVTLTNFHMEKVLQ